MYQRYMVWMLKQPPLRQAVLGGASLGLVLAVPVLIQFGVLGAVAAFCWCVGVMFFVGLFRKYGSAKPSE